MKKLFIALFVCSFMMVPQTSNAQFLKQLGKIAEDIGNDILSSPTAVSAEKVRHRKRSFYRPTT